MKKTLYTLVVNNYAPNLTKLTLPLMKSYAKKIGADFHVINERKFTDFPCPYEKFQIKELAAKNGDEWSLFFDADALIHPDFWDPTEVVGKDTTISNGTDFTPVRFKADKYFKRDGRFIGKGNWCMIASDWCTDIWSPLDDMTPDQAAGMITPTLAEYSTVVEPKHLIDDYTVSRNIARYGLKHVLIPELSEQKNARAGLLWHHYLVDITKKEYCMKKVILSWAISAMDPGLYYDPLIIKAKSVISDWDYNRSLIDWEELLSIIPLGQKIADIIGKYGVEIKLKQINKLSTNAKKQFLIFAIEPAQKHPNIQMELQNITGFPDGMNIKDYISASQFKDVIMGSVASWGVKL